MALSQRERRILLEIEQGLETDDPALAKLLARDPLADGTPISWWLVFGLTITGFAIALIGLFAPVTPSGSTNHHPAVTNTAVPSNPPPGLPHRPSTITHR